jgi:hypothetical protein
MATPELTTEQMIKHIYSTVNNIEATMKQQQAKVESLENDVTRLNKQVYDLQNIVNAKEQESRGLSVRITGVPFPEEEKASTDGKFLMKKVYNRILQPVLTAAKSKNHIERVPTMANTVQSCYRVGAASFSTGTGAPPPIVLKFVNEVVRLAILRNKKIAMPSPLPEEKDMGIVRFSMTEDLTPPSYKLLKELQRREEVTKVWTVNGRILWTRSGSQVVHRVKSVFDPVDTIIAKASA